MLLYDRNVNEPWWRKLLVPFPGPFSISILRSLWWGEKHPAKTAFESICQGHWPPVHESLVNRPLTVTVHVTRCITVCKQFILSNKFSRGAVHCGQLWCTISESNRSAHLKTEGAIDRHNAGFGSTISKCDMSWWYLQGKSLLSKVG